MPADPHRPLILTAPRALFEGAFHSLDILLGGIHFLRFLAIFSPLRPTT